MNFEDYEFTINHVCIDNEGDICIQSTDAESNTCELTCEEILDCLKECPDDKSVYFLEEDEREDLYYYDIDDSW